MGRVKRSEEPIEGVKHGTVRGYDAGCGCLPCRRKNRERVNNYNDRKREREAAAPNPTVVGAGIPGKFVSGARAFIDQLALDSEEATLLADLMIFNAQLLDNIAATNERWHLANSTQKSMLEIKGQLRRLKDGGTEGGKPAPTGDPKDELAGLLGGLTQQG